MAGRGNQTWRRCKRCRHAFNKFGSLGAGCSVHRQGPVLKGEVISLGSSSVHEMSFMSDNPDQATAMLEDVNVISNKNKAGNSDVQAMTMCGKPLPPPNPTSMKPVMMPEIISVSSSSPCVMSDMKNDKRKFHKPGASLD